MDVLESKAEEVECQLVKDKEQNAADKPTGKPKRNSSRKTSPSQATNRSLAQALGERVPVPELQPEKSATLASKRVTSRYRALGQAKLDRMVSSSLLPEGSQGNVNGKPQHFTHVYLTQSVPVSFVSFVVDTVESASDSEDDDATVDFNGPCNTIEANSSRTASEWCTCSISEILHKHCEFFYFWFSGSVLKLTF